MVCQSAGQTRFRALKYENGTAGNNTIVVKVIACFQPLQDCQYHLENSCSDIFRRPFIATVSNWMGEDGGFMFSPQQLNSLTLNPNPLFSLSHPRHQETVASSNYERIDTISANGVLPLGTQLSRSQMNERNVQFSRLPRFQQAFTPSEDPFLKELFPVSPCGLDMENGMPKTGAECDQKRFLVFDQSGDKTTLVFSSGGNSSWLPTSWSPKPPGVNANIFRTKELNSHLGFMLPCEEFDKSNGLNVKSEMHEDTEELNALLYSDDESEYSDDDEVTSSGHSPSSISYHVDHQASVGSTQGIGTSVGHNKKRKIQDDCNDGTLSLNVNENKLAYEDKKGAEADPTCGNGDNSGSMEFSSSSSVKRVKNGKIYETVNLLRSIVPGGEGAEPIAVLDKAIAYLMTLKLKAKTLGLDSL